MFAPDAAETAIPPSLVSPSSLPDSNSAPIFQGVSEGNSNVPTMSTVGNSVGPLTAVSSAANRYGEDFDELSPVDRPILDATVSASVALTPPVSASTSATNLAGMTSGTNIPSNEERVQKQAERSQQLSALLLEIDDKSLDNLFNAATSFWKNTSAGRAATAAAAAASNNSSNASSSSTCSSPPSMGGSTAANGSGSSSNHGSNGSAEARLVALQRASRYGAFSSTTVGTSGENVDSMTETVKTNASTCSNSSNGSVSVGLNEAQMDAWKSLGDAVSVLEAKKLFVTELLTWAPYWKYEQFL
jgi:ribosomal protein L12E/L44/L45/RPP1/RPP2